MVSKVSLRYAKAIRDLVGDSKKAKTIIDELRQFATVLAGHKELQIVLNTPVFPAEKREGVVKDLASKMKLSKTATDCLMVIAQGGRMSYLQEISDRVNHLVLEDQGVVPLYVESSTELATDQREKISKKFHTILGKDVEATYVVAPSLLGGLRVRAAGKTYDGSVVGWLNGLEETLVGGRT